MHFSVHVFAGHFCHGPPASLCDEISNLQGLVDAAEGSNIIIARLGMDGHQIGYPGRCCTKQMS